MKRRVHLVMIPENGMTGLSDFRHIAGIIRQRCDDVLPHVIKARHAPLLQARFWHRPTLYVGFYHARGFQPLRGECLRGESMRKSRQYRILRDAGIRVPDWCEIHPDSRFKVEDWGEHVLVKPDNGRMGGGIRLRLTRRISLAKDCPGGTPHIVQRFVHTGPLPISYRVCTLFGEVMYLMKSTNVACGNPLRDAASIKQSGGHNPVATAAKGCAELVIDGELVELARDIATRVFPRIPLLGQDFIRDSMTGEIHCLEVNPGGSTWHFSGSTGRSLQDANGFHFETQFGAFDIAARALIEAARRLAR